MGFVLNVRGMFNWFKRFEKKIYTLTMPIDLYLKNKHLFETRAISSMAAFSSVWNVYSCIMLIANTAAKLPIQLKERKQDGTTEIVQENEILRLFRFRPNQLHSGADLMRYVCIYLLVDGNSYLEINRLPEKKGKSPNIQQESDTIFKNIYPLKSQNVMVEMSANKKGDPVRSYRDTSGEKERIIPGEKVIHIMLPNPLNFTNGLSPASVVELIYRMQNASDNWNLNLITNNCRPSLILKFKTTLRADQREKVKKSLEEDWEGPNNAAKVKIIEGDMDVDKVSFSPTDIDWIGAQTLNTQKICSVFHVPPEMLGESSKTYENFKQARISLYIDTVIPFVSDILASVSKYFWPTGNKWFAVDIQNIEAIQEALKDKVKGMENAWYLTPNEKRKEVGFSELQDPNMNKIYMPQTMTPLDQVNIEPTGEEGEVL